MFFEHQLKSHYHLPFIINNVTGYSAAISFPEILADNRIKEKTGMLR